MNIKMHGRFLWLCCIFLLNIASCGPSRPPIVPTTPSIPTGTVAPTVLEPPQMTPSPSQTAVTLVIPSATIATVAIVPTLVPDQAYNFLQQLVEGSSDCQLPCWAGISPGVTTNAEAEVRIQPLSVLIYGGPYYPYKDKYLSGPGGGRDFYFGDTKIRFDFGWVTERGKETVEFLGINADALTEDSGWLYGADPYNYLFEKYDLHNILSKHGIPSEVWTIAEVYDYGDDIIHPNSEEFHLLLFYDKGIFIKYTMPLKRIGQGLGEACPSEAFFDMGLVASEASDFYQGLWFSSVTGSQDFSAYMSIEKATQMTFGEFNRAFMESNEPCFETPLSIWSKH
jgi:hypothetical protein